MHTVTLEKTSAGLGFSLEGGKGSLLGDKPLTVNRIFKGVACVCVFAFSPVVGVGQAPTRLLGTFWATLVSHNPVPSWSQAVHSGTRFCFFYLLSSPRDSPLPLLIHWVLVRDEALGLVQPRRARNEDEAREAQPRTWP